MTEQNDDEISIDTDVPPPFIGITIVYVILLIAGFGLMRANGVALMADSSLAALGRDALLGLGIGLALVLFSGLLRARSRLFDALEETVRERLGGLELGRILALALLSALAEEFFFRGFVQSYISSWSGSPPLGLVLTSVGFGLLHTGPVARFWPWTLFATACGFILGWLWLVTEGLLAPVLVHFLVNGVNMARILAGSRRHGARPEAPH